MSPMTRLANFSKRLHHDNRGVAAVEFALCSTVLLLLFMGTVDLGFAFRHRNQIENAVRDGLERARIEATNLNYYQNYENTIEALVTNAPGLPSTTPAITANAILHCRCVTTTGSSVTESADTGTQDESTTPSPATGCEDNQCTSPAVMTHFVEITAQQPHNFILGMPMIPNPVTLTVIKDIKVPANN